MLRQRNQARRVNNGGADRVGELPSPRGFKDQCELLPNLDQPVTPEAFEQLFRSVLSDAVAKELWFAGIAAGLDPESILGTAERAVVSGRVNEGDGKRTPAELVVGDRVFVEIDKKTYVARVDELPGNGAVTIVFRGLAGSEKSWCDIRGGGTHF